MMRGATIVSWILVASAFVGSSSLAFPPTTPAATHLTATTPNGKIVIALADGTGRRVLADGWESFVSPTLVSRLDQARLRRPPDLLATLAACW